jgi:hypothetical protein
MEHAIIPLIWPATVTGADLGAYWAQLAAVSCASRSQPEGTQQCFAAGARGRGISQHLPPAGGAAISTSADGRPPGSPHVVCSKNAAHSAQAGMKSSGP